MAPERQRLVVRRGRWKEEPDARRGEKRREAIVGRSFEVLKGVGVVVVVD